jgi:two-component system OmpR family sensor kinase
MWRLLIQVFPLAVISLMGVSTVIITLSMYIFDAQLEKDAITRSNSHVLLLKNYLNPTLSQEDWQQRFDSYKKNYLGTINVTSISQLKELNWEKRQRLLSGETVATMNPNLFFNLVSNIYFRVGQTDNVVYFSDSSVDVYQFDQLSFSANLIILLVVLFFISIWLSFHWSELRKLMRAADQIGQGDFSARAKLKKYASTYLIGEKINQMASHIERLVNGQRELIHSVSHELRTPIARLEFGLEMLKEIGKNPKLNSRIDDLKSDVNELSELVNELLQLAAVGQQYLAESKSFDISTLLHSSLQVLKHDKAHKKITVALPDNLGKYIGDQRLLERAVRNLLSNADKYSLTQIRLSAKKLFNGGYEIAVDDDGPGIPEDERNHVFEPFYRLENVWDKKISGYGLGLAIVQKVVAVHNGTIKVTASELGGARFVIRLPAVKAASKKSLSTNDKTKNKAQSGSN